MSVDVDPALDFGRYLLTLNPDEFEQLCDDATDEEMQAINVALHDPRLEDTVAQDPDQWWRENPATMANYLTGGDYQLYRYIALIGDRIRRAFEPETREDPHQMVWVPSQYGKTTLIANWTPIWALDRSEGRLRIMYVSYDQDKATSEAGKALDLAIEHAGSLRFEVRPGQSARGMWSTTAGGGLYAVGINGGIVGWPADVLLLDDIIKGWQDAHSPTIRERAWNIYRSQIRMRIQSNTGPIFMAGTRWHEDDPPARLLTLARAEPYADQWTVTRLPAFAETPDPTAEDPIYREPDALGRAPGEIIEPLRFPIEEVRARAVTAGSYLCTPAETPIVMADWTVKQISDIRVGDQVLGYVSEAGHKRRWERATVEQVVSKAGVVADYHMTSGRTIRATRDHRWSLRAGRGYQEAKVGTPLVHAVEVDHHPTVEELGWWQYLAGLVDGEGHISPTRRLNLVQGTGRNAPVAARMMETLDALGLDYTATHHAAPRDGWQDRVSIDISTVGRTYRTLLRHTHLAKRDQVIACLYAGAGGNERRKDRVLAIDGDTPETVYALKTSTGNYVAWGYLSANSAAMEQQRPAPEEGDELKREWWRLDDAYPPRFDIAITSWDMKLKDKESGDYVVGQSWGRTGKDCYLYDGLRGQWNQATTENAIALLTVRHPEATVHLIENTGNGPEVMTELRRAMPGYVLSDDIAGQLGMTGDERETVQALRRRGMTGLVPVNVKGDKSVRMRAYSGHIEAGDVHVFTGWSGHQSFVNEASGFPHGAHDDQVDTCSQALKRLYGGEASVRAARSMLPKTPIASPSGPASPLGMQPGQVPRRSSRAGRVIVPRLGRR